MNMHVITFSLEILAMICSEKKAKEIMESKGESLITQDNLNKKIPTEILDANITKIEKYMTTEP